MKSPLPRAAINQNVIVLGKTRSGKSSAMRFLVEGILDEHKPTCIIDPKGDWWGLKLGADGKSAGYPVIIFGGEHADLPINAHAGAHIAELITSGNRPCIIDLGGWSVADRTRFFIEFAAALFKMVRGGLYLVIDECHNFAPKGRLFDPEAAKMLHWANRLASEGLGKGVMLISASQRPQKVHNDYLTSHETLIAKRVIHEADRRALNDWIDGCGDPKVGKEMVATLADLDRSEAWAWSPEIKFGPSRVTFPFFSTYDSFKPQPAGAVEKLKGWASVDLDEVRGKLTAVVEEAKQNDPKALKAELAKANAELAKLRKAPAAVVSAPHADAKAIVEAHNTGYAKGWTDGDREGFARGAGVALDQGFGAVRDALKAFVGVQFVPGKPPKRVGSVPPAPHQSVGSVSPAPVARAVTQSAPRAPRTVSGGDGVVSLPPGERAVLIAAAQYDDVGRDQLSVLTGYKRSSRDAYIQRLREKGYITANGQTITITAEGCKALPPEYEPLPTGADLQAYWLQRLPEGERKVLAVLIERYPDAVPRTDIDDATGYKRSSRDTYIQRLKSRRLLTTAGSDVRASEMMF